MIEPEFAMNGDLEITNLGIREILLDDFEQLKREVPEEVHFEKEDFRLIVEDRLRDVGGVCNYRTDPPSVSVDSRLYRMFGKDTICGTFRHELAHIEADIRWGYENIDGHGKRFEKICTIYRGDFGAPYPVMPNFVSVCKSCKMGRFSYNEWVEDDTHFRGKCPYCGGSMEMILPEIPFDQQKHLGNYSNTRIDPNDIHIGTSQFDTRESPKTP